MANEVARKLLVEDSALLVACQAQSWIGSRTLSRRWIKIRDREMEETVRFLDTYASIKNVEPTSFVVNPKASHEEYPGIWAHQSAVMTKSNPDGDATVGVAQTLQEVFAVSGIADLVALNRRRVVEDKREAEFDFQDGRADDITLVFPFLSPDAATEAACMSTITEANLLTLAPGGYVFFQRQWQVDVEAHVAEFTVRFRAIEWNVWGHDAYAEDYREYSNTGPTNSTEVMIRTWVHIRNSDVATAVAYLRAGSATPAGYSIRSINVANGGNGACTITVREGVTNVNGSGSGYEVLRPFGWPECVGIRETSYVEYSGFVTEALLETAATGATTPPAGFTYTGYDGGSDSDGLFRRRYTYEKVTWSNYTPTVFKQVGEQNTQGNGKIQTKQACALPQGQVVAAFAAIAADTGYVLTSKGINPVGNGEFSLTAAQEVVYTGTTAADALLVGLSAQGDGSAQTRGLQRVWFRRSASAREALLNPSAVEGPPEIPKGEAVSDYTYDGLLYEHSSASVTDHHDGTYTVTQSLYYGRDRRGGGSRYDRNDAYLAFRDRALLRISGNVEFRAWATRSRYEKIFTSKDKHTDPEDPEDPESEETVSEGGAEAAWAWALSNAPEDTGFFDDATGEAVSGKDLCTVDYVGNDRWRGSYTTIVFD